MDDEIVRMSESLPTIGAFVWSFTVVHADVDYQVTSLCKTLRAFVAGERLLARVTARVSG